MEIQRSTIVWGKPRDIYSAWLNSEIHSRLAGSDTQIAPREGAVFNVGDGEIVGTNRHLEPGAQILQSMRTADFPSDHPDSLVDVRFDALDGAGTRVVLTQSEVPVEAQDWFDEHWEGFFSRLAAHFGVPSESKIASLTGGSEPRIPLEPALKQKPRRKPARSRPSLQAEKARRPRARAKPARTAGKKTPAPSKPGGRKAGRRSTSLAAGRITVSRPAAKAAKTAKPAKEPPARKTARPARGRSR